MKYRSLDAHLGKKRSTESAICELWESLLLSQRRGLELLKTSIALQDEIKEVRCQLQETRSKVAETIAEGRDRFSGTGTPWGVGSHRPRY